MTSFRDEWDTEMALAVLQSKNVDSKLWGEAVKWLYLYGPPAVREMIGQASSLATSLQFPELAPVGYSDSGEPLYEISQLAATLGVSEEEIIAGLSAEERENAAFGMPGRTIHRIN